MNASPKTNPSPRAEPKTVNKAARPRTQHAALPYRRTAEGAIEVLLITSRETQRWIIPKGWPQRGQQAHKSAAREAFEEAGVIGHTDRHSVGRYKYRKRLKDGSDIVCRVDVYLLEVTEQRDVWPEKRHRRLQWFPIEAAEQIVDDAELRPLLQKIGSAMTSRDHKRSQDHGKQMV